MDIYEQIINMDNDKNAMGISPLSYVVLDCAR